MPYNTLSSTKRGEMTKLSQGAQAVLDAFAASEGGVYLEGDPERLAAALRAAADQVVPGDGSRRANEIRADFLAIADELHSLVNTNTESSDCVWDQNYLR